MLGVDFGNSPRAREPINSRLNAFQGQQEPSQQPWKDCMQLVVAKLLYSTPGTVEYLHCVKRKRKGCCGDSEVRFDARRQNKDTVRVCAVYLRSKRKEYKNNVPIEELRADKSVWVVASSVPRQDVSLF